MIDAGIATDENLAMLTENRFDYVCVSRSKIKDYTVDAGSVPITVEDKKRQKIWLQNVVSEKHNDFFLKVESEAKRAKELSMNNRFQEGFEKGLSIIEASLSKKSGIKTEEKVYERVGRLKQKYPSVAKYYEITYTARTEMVKNRKTKENTEVRKVKAMSWKIKENMEPNEQSGVYFLRTSLNMSEKLLWMTYNIIREVAVEEKEYDQVMISHRCSDPTPKVEAIYRRLKYKPKPNTFRKFVVHKSEFQKMNNVDIYLFPT